MPFTGFTQKLPSYELILPQSKQEYTVRTMLVKEEEILKGSYMTEESVSEHINKTIFSCLQNKPEEVKRFEDFLAYTTTNDREAFIYALYHITYGEIRNYEIMCQCENKYSITVKASDTINILPYEGENIYTDIVEVKLKTLNNVSVFLKQPTLASEKFIIDTLKSRPGTELDLVYSILKIESIAETVEGGKNATKNVWTSHEDIYDAYCNIPSADKLEIEKVYQNKFGKYGVNLKTKATCPKCKKQEEVTIDLYSSLFRNLLEVPSDI